MSILLKPFGPSPEWLESARQLLAAERATVDECRQIWDASGKLCDLDVRLSQLDNDLLSPSDYLRTFLAIVRDNAIYIKLVRLQKCYDDGEIELKQFNMLLGLVLKRLKVQSDIKRVILRHFRHRLKTQPLTIGSPARRRLETINELLAAKLITQGEYDRKRQQIIDEL